MAKDGFNAVTKNPMGSFFGQARQVYLQFREEDSIVLRSIFARVLLVSARFFVGLRGWVLGLLEIGEKLKALRSL